MTAPEDPRLAGLPANLLVRGRRVLVVGGGRIAARKIASLLELGARVEVVAPAAGDEVRAWAQAERLTLAERPFAPADLDGMWLEPHRDIKEKLFSMVIYLCTGPFAKDWGTDIYDHDVKWCGRGTAEFNSAVIFIAGPHTWHGFEPRPIYGVRRLMEINYVSDTWRDKDQLAFPERPLTLA